MQPVLFDTDLGVDDALAIAIALNAAELDVIGLTLVAGNVSVEQGTRSALQLLQLLGREDVPVYVGAEKPLFTDRVDAVQVHGSTGWGMLNYLNRVRCRLVEPSIILSERSRSVPESL